MAWRRWWRTLRRSLLRILRWVWRWVWYWFFGADYFISYARTDGRDHALGLVLALGKLGRTHAADFTQPDRGARVPRSILRRIATAKVFVLIVTPFACRSRAVLHELRFFSRFSRSVVQVRLMGAEPKTAIWSRWVKGYGVADGASWRIPSEPPDAVMSAIELPRGYIGQRTRQLATTFALSCLALSMLAFSAIELRQAAAARAAAEREMERAKRLDAQSRSREGASRAIDLLSQSLDRALMEAHQAFEASDTPEARAAVLRALSRAGPMRFARLPEGEKITGLAIARTSTTVIVATKTSVWSWPFGQEERAARRGLSNEASAVAACGDTVAVALWDHRTPERTRVETWDVRDMRAARRSIVLPLGYSTRLACALEGEVGCAVAPLQGVSCWRGPDARVVERWSGIRASPTLTIDTSGTLAAYSDVGDDVMVSSFRDWTPSAKPFRLPRWPGPGRESRDSRPAALGFRGDDLVLIDDHGGKWEQRAGSGVWRSMTRAEESAVGAAIDRSGWAPAIWKWAGRAWSMTIERPDGGASTFTLPADIGELRLAIADGGAVIAASSEERLIATAEMGAPSAFPICRSRAGGRPMRAASFSSDGRSLELLGEGEMVEVDLATGRSSAEWIDPRIGESFRPALGPAFAGSLACPAPWLIAETSRASAGVLAEAGSACRMNVESASPAALSADGRFMAYCDKGIWVWDLSGAVPSLRAAGGFSCFEHNPPFFDASALLVGIFDREEGDAAHLYRMRDLERTELAIIERPFERIWTAAISPDASLAITGMDAGRVHFRDLRSSGGLLLNDDDKPLIETHTAVTTVALSPDGKDLVLGTPNDVPLLCDADPSAWSRLAASKSITLKVLDHQ